MKLILNGGGIGKQVASARQLLNRIIDNSKKILYIPFAWPDSSYSGCLEFMTDELKDVEKAGIDMVRTPEELLEKNFNDYACLYIGGGNTFKLLDLLKKSGNYGKIKEYLENDGIVYGGSAGAIIFGKDLDSCITDDENKVGLEDSTGFNMINGYSLLCHFGSRDPKRTEITANYLKELSKIKPVYAIPEEDSIYVHDGVVEFIGYNPYYEFNNGVEEEKRCFVCKIATKEEKLKQLEYDKSVNPGEEENWDKWIEEFKKYPEGHRITYFGILNGEVITEASAGIKKDTFQNTDGLIDDSTAYLFAFRTKEEYQEQGYLSPLFKYMIDDLRKRGIKKVTIGVEPTELKNKAIYDHYGFTEHIKDAKETYPDGTIIDVEYYGKAL